MTAKVQHGKPRGNDERQIQTYFDALAIGTPVPVARSLAGLPADGGELENSVRGAIEYTGSPALSPAAIVAQMQAEAVVSCLRVIKSAAQDGEWRAAAWLLERLRPVEYGPARLQAAPATMQQTVQVQVAAGAIVGAVPALQAGGEPMDFAAIVAAARLIVARADGRADDTGGAGDDGTA